MNKIEIIDEMIQNFSVKPRARNGENSSCCYLNEEGHRCGHSIFIRDEVVNEFDERQNTSSTAEDIIAKYGDDCHKEQYRGHQPNFWLDIQNLHDYNPYWNDKSLTAEGLEKVAELKEKWK